MNMCKVLFSVAAIAVAGAVFAADTNAAPRKITKRYKATGGKVEVPDSRKGKIVVFNAQKKVALQDYRAPLDAFEKSYGYRVEFADCEGVSPKTASGIMQKGGAQVAVFLTECAECPLTMLVAPDARWAIVNVAEIVKGAKNKVFEVARTRKALMRAFLCAAGGMNSQYEGSEMAPIRSAADLDKLVEEPPLDLIMRIEPVLKYSGVCPVEYTTYLKACEQGWAQKPKDEYQQKIWDDVHAMPSAPLKIEK